MLICHTISSLDNPTSGVGVVAPFLCRALAKSKLSVELISLGVGRPQKEQGIEIFRCMEDFVVPRMLSKLGRSRQMREKISNSSAEIFHTHGMWMMPNVYPADAAQRRGKPFLVSPHGMLGRDALKFSATAKRVFWEVWQKNAFSIASCFHATAASEFDDIREFGLKQPIAVIPNGIDLPCISEFAESIEQMFVHKNINPYVVSLGRIHPKKGLDRLISGFALIAHEYPALQLRIVGPDEGGHAADLRRQSVALGISDRVSIEPPAFGKDKTLLLRNAEVFALSTLHENFALTVAESLSVETPVISTKGAPWAGLEENNCGWWIDHGPEALAAALRQALAMPQASRRAMGARGREWMQRDFAWDGIGAKMADVYSWTLGRAERPPWVWD